MARRRRRSSGNALKPVLQALICAIGLAVGVAIGGLVIYTSGLWNELGRVVGEPFSEITKTDLLYASAPIAIVIVSGWIGTRLGMRLASKLEN